MRPITHLVVHCTATPQDATVEAIQRYWKRKLGWKSPGYHKVIRPDGLVITLALDSAPTNGVAGHNATSLHVSYIGGVDVDGVTPKDTRTDAQKASLLKVLREWRAAYPGAGIKGHRDFPGVHKACPSFDARKEYAGL